MTASAAAAMDGEIQLDMPGCATKEVMKRIVELATQKDYAASDALLKEQFLRGDCRFFVKGQKIVLESREIFSGLSHIHITGDWHAFWVINKTIDPQ